MSYETVVATERDFRPWLNLAAEVEDLFGTMVADTDFLKALQRNLDRGTAICIRSDEEDASYQLVGAALFSYKEEILKITWLAVGKNYRRKGVARKLIDRIFELAPGARLVLVETFTDSCQAGNSARELYLGYGFIPGEIIPKKNNQIYDTQIFELDKSKSKK